MIESQKGIRGKKFAIWLLLRSNIMRARVGSKIGVVTVGVVANQAIIAKTTWFYLAQVGWVWLRETRFYLLQLFKMSLSFTVDSAIRGHHIYKTIWTPQLDETLSCETEPGNIHDPYAVAVKRTSDNTIVGHVPRKVSAVCSLFLRRGTMVCVVTGNRRHFSDLPQGGLEVPCTLTFNGTKDNIEKVKRLWERAPRSEYQLQVVTTIESPTTQSTCSADEPLPKNKVRNCR